jgi:hypothetical protein
MQTLIPFGKRSEHEHHRYATNVLKHAEYGCNAFQVILYMHVEGLGTACAITRANWPCWHYAPNVGELPVSLQCLFVRLLYLEGSLIYACFAVTVGLGMAVISNAEPVQHTVNQVQHPSRRTCRDTVQGLQDRPVAHCTVCADTRCHQTSQPKC